MAALHPTPVSLRRNSFAALGEQKCSVKILSCSAPEGAFVPRVEARWRFLFYGFPAAVESHRGSRESLVNVMRLRREEEISGERRGEGVGGRKDRSASILAVDSPLDEFASQSINLSAMNIFRRSGLPRGSRVPELRVRGSCSTQGNRIK